MKNSITDEETVAMLEDLKMLVSCPSVLAKQEEGAPFGVGIQKALKEILAICDKLGFKTKIDPKGYYGYADIGESDEILGVICHVDVVPIGETSNWDTDPFHLTQKDGILYGRGVQDDKGPTIACLYALKHALNNGLKLKYKVRFIFETDEETLWRGIEKYKENEDKVTLGFAPDSAFPVTNAEKGLLQATLIGKGFSGLNINCKNAFNVVPDEAIYSGEKPAEVAEILKVLGYGFEEVPEGIKVKGKSVHSMAAPQGINAVTRLGIALSKIYNCPALNFISEKLGEDATGSGVVGKVEDDVSGSLTFNLSSLEINSDFTKMNIDLRIPVLVEKEKLLDKLIKVTETYGLEYQEVDYLAPMYVPDSSELVQKLMKVYEEKTGDSNAKTKSSGGATLARSMKNCVAFGGMFPSTPDFMHQPNEQWSLEELKKTMELFIGAFEELNS